MSDLKTISSQDLKLILLSLSNPSNKLEKIKSVLKDLWIFASENVDTSVEMLGSDGVKFLSDLFLKAQTEDIEVKIKVVGILIAISFSSDKSNENELLSILIAVISNVLLAGVRPKFVHTVYQRDNPNCLEVYSIFIKDSSSFSSSSGSSSSFSARSSLSVTAFALVLGHAAATLLTPSVADHDKQDVLNAIIELVETHAMDEAAAFVSWWSTATRIGVTSAVPSSGVPPPPQQQQPPDMVVGFVKAYEDFGKAVKGLSEGKKKIGVDVYCKGNMGSDGRQRTNFCQ